MEQERGSSGSGSSRQFEKIRFLEGLQKHQGWILDEKRWLQLQLQHVFAWKKEKGKIEVYIATGTTTGYCTTNSPSSFLEGLYVRR